MSDTVVWNLVNSPNDVCPGCKSSASRVFGKEYDAQGKEDLYICDKCSMCWPTEWADDYKYKVQIH